MPTNAETRDNSLSCHRCTKTATVYIPEVQRVLCDDHFDVFSSAYDGLKTSSVKIEDYLVDAIKQNLPKESSDRATGIEFNHRVPVTLITDHLGQLATGVEPATCTVCGKSMQLHGQWATTKQQMMGSAPKGALDPDFLAKFDEFGNCLDCKTKDGISRGFKLVDAPMTKDDMIAHLNGHGHKDDQVHRNEDPNPSDNESGNVHLMEILSSPMANVNRARAIETNFPIYVEDGVVFWNPKHRAKKEVFFPIGMSDWNPEVDDEGNTIPGTGITFPSYNWFHSFLSHITGNFAAPNSCPTCEGTGIHPNMDEEDVQGHYQEQAIYKQEAAQKMERSLKKQKTQRSRIAHSGPGIKPHDHHHKKQHYSPRNKGLGGSLPTTSGKGKAFRTTSFQGFDKIQFPAVERWWYDTMNMFHDMTHTEYKTPSYMYRNPNPMYYSPGSKRNFVSKPWRN